MRGALSTFTQWRADFAGSIRPGLLLRLAVVAGVLLLVSGLGYKGSISQLKLVLLGIFGIPAVIVFLRWPALGIFGIIASGMLIHYTGPGGLNATIVLIILLVVLWLADMVIFQPEIRIVVSRTLPPIYALLLISLIGFGMGLIPWFSTVQSAPIDAQVGGFAVYALSYVVYILVANQVSARRTLQWLTWGFVALGSVYVSWLLFLRAINLVGLLLPSLQAVFGAVYGNLGSSFYIWLIAIAYSQAIFNRDLLVKWRVLLFGIVLAGMYILFVLKFDDKSGWVPIFVVIWVITWLRSWRIGLVMTIGVILVGFSFIPQILATEDYSLSTRLEILPIFWQLIRTNPLFGTGFANYHFYTELFSLRGWYTSFNSHNNYVDVVVQTGVIGLLCLLWFLARSGLLGLELRKRVDDGFSKAYVNGALGGLAGGVVVSALGDWLLPFVYNIGLRGFRSSVLAWFFLGGLVLFERIHLPQVEDTAV